MRRDLLDADLLWRFGEAAGDLGLRAAALEPMTRGAGGGPPEMSPRALAAATRCRLIDEALAKLPSATVRVLQLAHTEAPPAVRRRWDGLGELAGVVLHLEGAEAMLVALADRRGKDSKRKASSEVVLSAAQVRAHRAVVAGVAAYRAARGVRVAEERTKRRSRREKRQAEWKARIAGP